ncbi:MAG: peroxiredoxin [Rickettsiales bacterium]
MSVLVGKEAPDFTAQAVLGDNSIKVDFNLKSFIKGKIGVLFFWPLDFTFVCPSEIIAFDNRVDEFKKRGAEIIGVSVDSQYTHYAWKNTPVEKGGIGNIRFPLVADITKSIARSYDVLTGDAVAFRGTFMIDKKGIVRHQLVNDLPLGRNVDEAIRMVDALNFHEEHGEVCPANWKKGEKGMKANAEGVASYLKEKAKAL